MKKSFLMIAAALFILAGCQKEESVNESTSNNVIHIGVTQIAPPTKVAANDIAASPLTFKWEEGDQVAFDDDNRIIIYTCTDPATGEFSGEALDPDATYWVEYPNGYSGTFIYRGNQIPKGHHIMNEEVSGSATTFTLDTHETIIHFKLKGAAKVGSIALSNGDADDDYTLSCGDGVQLSDTATDFYMDAMYVYEHKLSSFAYTLRIYDTNNKELKSVSFYLKEENQGTMVDFDTPIEVNAATGTAKRTGDIDVNWVQLWENGPKFAECNIGADKATDYGYYLAWGGSSDKDATYNAGSADLSGSDDSAYKVWGEHWRMPTNTDFSTLMSNCTCTWKTNYNGTGVNGLLCTGKGDYSSNSIFLPAAGYSDGIVSCQGSIGYYWSSTPCGSDDAYGLGIKSSGQLVDYCSRNNGLSVRPIYVEDIVAVTGVSLNKTELKVGKGNTETLSATVNPTNATNKKVLWTSSDEKVATVDAYGKVTGVKTGECVITATTEDGGKTATCIVKVVVPTTGTAKATIGGSQVDVNWIQLWENGPKFAEYNVGVTDGKAESYGGLYCWGKATDKDLQGAYKGGTSALTGTDDTATNLWGSNWRMPTQTELQGLIDNCDVAWTTVGGKKGSKFTGKGAYASNSVFLPAVGQCCSSGVDTPGLEGYYWSSTPDASNSEKAYHLDFFPKTQGGVSQGVYKWYRKYGNSVRAVLAK